MSVNWIVLDHHRMWIYELHGGCCDESSSFTSPRKNQDSFGLFRLSWISENQDFIDMHIVVSYTLKCIDTYVLDIAAASGLD